MEGENVESLISPEEAMDTQELLKEIEMTKLELEKAEQKLRKLEKEARKRNIIERQ